MTLRAVIIGIMLGLGVAGITYFNDAVAHSTMLIGNQFPIGVFGALMLLLLGVNPLLGRLRKHWPLRPRELALVTALGLAVCGWPGSGLFRYFAADMALPSKMINSNPAWQAAHIMSYVPGGSARLGMGHLRDVPSLTGTLTSSESGEVRPVDRLVWEHLSMSARQLAKEVVRTGQVTDADKLVLLNALNEVIGDRNFYTSFDAQQLPEEARSVMVQRDQLIAEGNGLEDRRSELLRRRNQLQTEREPQLQEFGSQRSSLLTRRNELAANMEDVTAKSIDLKLLLDTLRARRADSKAEISSLTEQVASLRKESVTLANEIDVLDGKIGVADRQIDKLRFEIDRLDNESHRIEAILLSIRRRTGAEDQTGLLEERINRLVLASSYPHSISPPPRGGGILATEGDADPYVVDTLNQGWDGPQPLGLTKLPWKEWWPTLRLWGTVAILMAIAFLCMTVIVHPQWSRRELLAYPIARFVEEVTQVEGKSNTPRILRSRLFWYGFGALIVLHIINGLHRWLPDQMFFQVPLIYDFSALAELMPNAMRIPSSPNLWPRVYLSVLAFAYFLNSDVSFSLGIAPFAWGMLGAFCYSHGISAEYSSTYGKELNLLLFGGCLGMTVMVLYTGRRYYLNVLTSALGFKRQGDTPGYATWAARVFALCLVGSVLMLWKAGLDWPFGILVLALVLVTGLVIARVNAESGLFFLQLGWYPAGVLVAFLGVEAISPQVFIVLALTSLVLVGDPRETIMPYLVNGLRMITGARRESQEGQTPVRRAAPLLAMMVVLGFLVALGVTFYLQYNRGFNHLDGYATRSRPAIVFSTASGHVSKLAAKGRLTETTNYKSLEWIKSVAPNRRLMVWAGVGFGLVVACSIARLRLSWWFIHPVLFIFWGGWSRKMFATSFLLGFLVKIAIVKLGGAKSYRKVKPLMVGIIAGELVAGLGWMLVAAIYWALAGQAPIPYSIMPG